MDHRVMPTDTQSPGRVCCNPHQKRDRRSHPESEEDSQEPLTHLTASFPSLAPSPAVCVWWGGVGGRFKASCHFSFLGPTPCRDFTPWVAPADWLAPGDHGLWMLPYTLQTYHRT